MISRLETPQFILEVNGIRNWLYQAYRWFSQAESGEFLATLTGFSGTVSGTVEYTVNGDTVTLSFPDITGTSNSTDMTATGLPDDLYPSSTRDCVGIVYNNSSTTSFGRVSVGDNGTITFYTSASTGTFANTNTKGVRNCSLTYKL